MGKSAAIRCMDSRLNGSLGDKLKEMGLDASDMISLAGSSLAVAQGSIWLPWRWPLWATKMIMIYHLRLAVRLHGVKTVVVVHHSNCGAYASRYSFSSLREEKNIQCKDMRRTRRVLLKKFPDLEVMLVWAELQEEEGIVTATFSIIE